MKNIIFVILLMLPASPCFAVTDRVKEIQSFGEYENRVQTQEETAPQANAVLVEQTANVGDKMAHEYQMLKEKNKVEAVIVLCILAFISLVAVLYFIEKKSINSGQHIVNATGLIFIIFGTLLLVIMAQTEQQLTAAIGILGGVAGYLFGSMKHKSPDEPLNESAK